MLWALLTDNGADDRDDDKGIWRKIVSKEEPRESAVVERVRAGR